MRSLFFITILDRITKSPAAGCGFASVARARIPYPVLEKNATGKRAAPHAYAQMRTDSWAGFIHLCEGEKKKGRPAGSRDPDSVAAP